jgi:hypothetical protein
MNILMNTKVYKKKGNTKTVFILVNEDNVNINEDYYDNLTNPINIKQWRQIGYNYRVTKNYTCRGYKVIKISGFDPKKTTKFVVTFKFN